MIDTLKKSPSIELHPIDKSPILNLPFIGNISAGFPSPAEDFMGEIIDLNKELIKNRPSTFCGRIKGNSMRDAGIDNGDLLIIDKSLEATNGRIVVFFLDGEFLIKRIKIEKDCLYLVPANSDFNPIKVTSENEFLIWGVVKNIIKSV